MLRILSNAILDLFENTSRYLIYDPKTEIIFGFTNNRDYAISFCSLFASLPSPIHLKFFETAESFVVITRNVMEKHKPKKYEKDILRSEILEFPKIDSNFPKEN